MHIFQFLLNVLNCLWSFLCFISNQILQLLDWNTVLLLIVIAGAGHICNFIYWDRPDTPLIQWPWICQRRFVCHFHVDVVVGGSKRPHQMLINEFTVVHKLFGLTSVQLSDRFTETDLFPLGFLIRNGHWVFWVQNHHVIHIVQWVWLLTWDYTDDLILLVL